MYRGNAKAITGTFTYEIPTQAQCDTDFKMLQSNFIVKEGVLFASAVYCCVYVCGYERERKRERK